MATGKKSAWEDIREGLHFILALVAIYFVVAYLFPDEWRIKWAVRYVVAFSHITVEPRPTLCDWWRAPLGRKACHYERIDSKKIVTLSTQGKPIVSYDDGKTWQKPPFDYTESELADLRLDRQRAEFISITWEKREDP